MPEDWLECNSALKIAGANEIIAVDLYESKLRLAKKCGATITINSKKINAWEMLNKRFKKVISTFL